MLAIEAVEHVATGHRRRPLVLTSDRGRGKSAALGIGAAHLMRRGIERIIVTAPRPDSAEQLFRHASRLLPGARSGRYSLSTDEAHLVFVAPDELVQTHPPADLLLVDEAAAIPTPMLERMLAQYSRIVFSTTVHGYEGTGRGFAVRFQQVLDHQTPGWRALRLHQPIRWAAQDPLERFVFRALLARRGRA
jgi:tRNA(Met) cytidine acetyltransferase